MITVLMGLIGGVPRLWLALGAGALVIGLLTGAYAKGHMDSTESWKAKENVRLLAAAKRRVELQEENDKLNEELETARANREVIVKTIIKKVPQYVQSPPAACADTGLHSPGFRVLYDAATAGSVPEPSAVATAAPVQATEAAVSIIEDITGCTENARKVEGWQDWYKRIPKAVK